VAVSSKSAVLNDRLANDVGRTMQRDVLAQLLRAKILSLNIAPHLKCVATLPCEMSVSYKQQLKQDDFL